jgi:CheY-like chemotaxis protein
MKKTLLIVDDDASVRRSIQKVLCAESYEVLAAADGQEALARLDRTPVDLVLLDINLPTRNGWEVFESITTKNPLLPVIIITGTGHQLPMASAAGVSALLEKPLDAPALLQAIQTALAEPTEQRLRRLLGQGEPPVHQPSAPPPLAPTAAPPHRS